MKISVGFEMLYDFPQPTPMIMVLGTHFTRASDVIVPDFLTTDPAVEITPYRDLFGNWCSRMVAPAGRMRLAADGVVRDSGLPDPVFASAIQHAVEDLPADTLVYLLGSRYCETDRLSDIVAACALLRQLAIVFSAENRIWSNKAASALYSPVS